MSTEETPAGLLSSVPGDVDDPTEELVDAASPYPPVVAVVVTRNPGPFLDDTLRSLAAQDYADLTVVVVDCGSDVDPTGRVAELLPRASVKRLDSVAGFAEAVNEVRTVEGATFVLACHDDVVLDATAVRLLVEEAYRSNAGVVGPKLVAAEDPRILLEVGRAIDRFGAPYTGIEPGEIDQEQHDGVRDVFYVSSAAMLVRFDLFNELGGFDPATFPGAEDLDLCWRSRLAGARVVVAPDARVAHCEAAFDRGLGDRPDAGALARSRVRVLLTSYSFGSLLWVIPLGVVVSFVEAIGELLTGRVRRARAAVGAWWSNLLHFRRLRPSRKRAQAARHVHDRDLRELQVRTSTRFQMWVSHHLHTDQRVRAIGDRGRSAVDTMSDALHTPATIAFMAFLALVAFGSRGIVMHGVPAIGTFATWPGVGDLFDAFGSGWRYTGLGSPSQAPPALALMGGLGTLLLGKVAFAQTLVVVLAIPIGAWGTYRLASRSIGLRGPALAAALAYGINPAPRNAIAAGRLGPLVLFAMAPFLLSLALGAGGLDRPGEEGLRRRGRLLRLALVSALLAAFYPAGLGLVVLACVVLVVSVPIAGGAKLALRTCGLAIMAAVGAVVLLFPWPLTYLTGNFDAASLGISYRTQLELGDVLRFQSGAQGSGWAMWGLLVAAAVPLFTARGPRLAWAARGWMLALGGWAAVWVPAEFFPQHDVLAPEAGLTIAALGLALALGVGVSVLVDGIREFRFGWRQPAAVLGGIALLFPVVSFTADTVDGRWHSPDHDWTQTLAFTASVAARGQFRMLWLGKPEVLPLDPVALHDGTAYTLTRNGPGDVTEQWRAPLHSPDDLVGRAIGLSTAGLTNRLGRMLAPMGVRYLAVPSTQGTGGGVRAPAPRALTSALAGQLDLARMRTPPGLVLYENLAWVPLRAVVPVSAEESVPVDSADPTRAALGVDLAPVAKPVYSGPVPAGTVLWGEAYDTDWSAASRSRDLRHAEAFGWSNAYRLGHAGDVSISYTAQWQRWALLAVSAVVWLVVARRWWKTRARRPRRVLSDEERRRRDRKERSGAFDELPTDDELLWWERV